MLANFYQKNIIEKPKLIFVILLIFLFGVGYYSKNKATYCHTISLKNNTPCWTLFFAFKQTRPWGFWKKDGENNYTWIESSEYFKID